ncbi:hypothetical protein CEXT_237471 [Caerostris extrusa]|uniref:Uncharacterized protein n=1 Tax=Caerostris extrusa TaxID=172846 RepID=A0AAV4VHB7_CAEEX|nr:hypothetical protein CEXT_237471 [Caerostris extrusa]
MTQQQAGPGKDPALSSEEEFILDNPQLQSALHCLGRQIGRIQPSSEQGNDLRGRGVIATSGAFRGY